MDGEATGTATTPNETAILLAFFLLTLAAVGIMLWREEHRLVHDPNAKAARGEVVGVSGDSLVRPANLRRALDKVAARMGSEDVVISLNLSPTRLIADTRDETGKERDLVIDPGFGVTSHDFGESDQPGVRVSAIDAAAPALMFDEVARRIGAQPKNLDFFTYAVLPTDRSAQWLLNLKDVPIKRKQWVADGHGNDLRREGEPSARQRAQQLCFRRARTAEQAQRCSNL